jgi:selenophosphate synthase
MLTNTGLRAGDAVVLTKMLGTGVVATAIKAVSRPRHLTATTGCWTAGNRYWP